MRKRYVSTGTTAPYRDQTTKPTYRSVTTQAALALGCDMVGPFLTVPHGIIDRQSIPGIKRTHRPQHVIATKKAPTLDDGLGA